MVGYFKYNEVLTCCSPLFIGKNGVTGLNQSQPLSHKRVLLTRATDGFSWMAEALTQAGAEVFNLPLTQVQPLQSPAPSLLSPEWLFFTSRNGLRYYHQFSQRLTAANPLPKLAVVGQAAAQLAKQLGYSVGFCPTQSQGAAFAAMAFNQTYVGQRFDILWPCGAQALPELEQILSTAGHRVERWPVYQSVPVGVAPPLPLDFNELSAVVFSSPLAIKTFAKLGLQVPIESRVVVLGQQSLRAAEAYLALGPQQLVKTVEATPEAVIAVLSHYL